MTESAGETRRVQVGRVGAKVRGRALIREAWENAISELKGALPVSVMFNQRAFFGPASNFALEGDAVMADVRGDWGLAKPEDCVFALSVRITETTKRDGEKAAKKFDMLGVGMFPRAGLGGGAQS